MILILMAEGELHAKLTVPDNTVAPPVVKYKFACLPCLKTHEAEFQYRGLHDDGPIYDLKTVHQ